jgi:DNA topoisomerase IB
MSKKFIQPLNATGLTIESPGDLDGTFLSEEILEAARKRIWAGEPREDVIEELAAYETLLFAPFIDFNAPPDPDDDEDDDDEVEKGGAGSGNFDHSGRPGEVGGSGGAGELDLSEMEKIGHQKGSNPGGTYRAKDGTKYYVKIPNSEDKARNEILTAKLYQEAGVNVPEVDPIKVGNKVGVASKIVEGVQVHQSPKNLIAAGAHDDFAADAWLANWDVVGLEYDNLGINTNTGKVIRMDTGGGLTYRAQGAPKGAAFGNSVGELKTFRDKYVNTQANSVFGSIPDKKLADSIQRVLDVPDHRIKDVVHRFGPKDFKAADELANKLINRKKDLSNQLAKLNIHKGGEGSGNFDHAGRPGEVGGSASFGEGGGGTAVYDKESKSWKDADGKELPNHVASLKIPPAWTEVRYNRDPDGALLVMGKDAKGRGQYLYSEKFKKQQSENKFARIKELDGKFLTIAKKVESDVKKSEVKEEASALRLIMSTGLRPGSDKDTQGKVQAYGATTLEGRHVVGSSPDNCRLQFVGKKGVELDIPIKNPAVAKDLIARRDAAGKNGKLFSTSAGKLSDYAQKQDGGGFLTKDFRTLVGTRTAMEEVAKMSPPKSTKEYKKAVLSVAKTVSTRLGNTPTVALQSYISPTVFAKWRL